MNQSKLPVDGEIIANAVGDIHKHIVVFCCVDSWARKEPIYCYYGL